MTQKQREALSRELDRVVARAEYHITRHQPRMARHAQQDAERITRILLGR